MHNTSRSATGL